MTATDIESIEVLDFPFEPMCEANLWHSDDGEIPYLGPPQPAVALIKLQYPCTGIGTLMLCKACMDYLLTTNRNVNCVRCPRSHPGPHSKYIVSVNSL